jgi:hypothetical protein
MQQRFVRVFSTLWPLGLVTIECPGDFVGIPQTRGMVSVIFFTATACNAIKWINLNAINGLIGVNKNVSVDTNLF